MYAILRFEKRRKRRVACAIVVLFMLACADGFPVALRHSHATRAVLLDPKLRQGMKLWSRDGPMCAPGSVSTPPHLFSFVSASEPFVNSAPHSKFFRKSPAKFAPATLP